MRGDSLCLFLYLLRQVVDFFSGGFNVLLLLLGRNSPARIVLLECADVAVDVAYLCLQIVARFFCLGKPLV